MRPLDPKYQYRNFIHPRYWGTWLFLSILYLISFLPYSAKLKLGEYLGTLAYRKGGGRAHTARCNIESAFPNKTPEEKEELIKNTLIANATGYFENTITWWGDMQPYIDTMKVYGKEHLDEALSRGNGVLLLGAHFSIMDFAGPLINSVTEFNYMYRPQNCALLNAFIERSRRRFSRACFDKKEIKEMISFIKEGNCVWYSPDQDPRRKHGVFAPFFGIQTATLTTPAWIAKETGATVLYYCQFRESHGQYSGYFSPIFENYPSGNDLDDATQMNQALETGILKHPEQYMWVHRRFKTRPPGEASFYERVR